MEEEVWRRRVEVEVEVEVWTPRRCLGDTAA